MGLIRRIGKRLSRKSVAAPNPRLRREAPKPFQPREWMVHTALPSSLSWQDKFSAVHQMAPGIHGFELLENDGMALLLSELDRYNAWAQLTGMSGEANSMHRAAVLCSELGLEPVIDHWLVHFLNPLREHLFPDLGPFVSHHAYFVQYGQQWDGDLGFHVDDADMTLNVCLEEPENGAEIYFEGKRCALHVDGPSEEWEQFEWAHRKGFGLIHHGKNRHGVRPIVKGIRRNLIVWCQSSEGRRNWERNWSEGICPDWCDHPKMPMVAEV